MNIELSYSEAVDVKYALEDVIKANQECLKDENFKKNYPGCANSLEQQLKRCQAVKQRIQEQLDKL